MIQSSWTTRPKKTGDGNIAGFLLSAPGHFEKLVFGNYGHVELVCLFKL